MAAAEVYRNCAELFHNHAVVAEYINMPSITMARGLNYAGKIQVDHGSLTQNQEGLYSTISTCSGKIIWLYGYNYG